MKRPSIPSLPRSARGKSRKVGLSYWVYRVIKETGWTIEELNKCPIPTFFMIIDELKRENEEQSKAFK